ncbi:MAG: hypothetical protein JNK05_09800 [Myxococcales bacterium]|nr:hypothetical protein [Myxococcales bacterium]
MNEINWDSQRWFGRTSKEMREHCLRWYVEPTARLLFASVPEAQSLVLAVGQFWSDEAHDAVHLALYASDEPDPSWPELAENSLFPERWERNKLSECTSTVSGSSFGDSNYGNIVAFASQCFMSSQDEPEGDAYQPWAVARRKGANDCTSKVVGELLQPSFEDNFNVGFSRIEGSDDYYDSAGERVEEIPLGRIKALVERGEAAEVLRVIEDELRETVRAISTDDGPRALENLAARLAAALQDATRADNAVTEEESP